MSSDRWQNDLTNLYFMFPLHKKLCQTLLILEKVIFTRLSFLVGHGFVRLNSRFFKYQLPHISHMLFFLSVSSDIDWNIDCTNYEQLRMCCGNEITSKKKTKEKKNSWWQHFFALTKKKKKKKKNRFKTTAKYRLFINFCAKYRQSCGF